MRYDSDFEIVHRDMKPGNGKKFHVEFFTSRDNSPTKSVFLGYENANKGFPFYPVAKLGDFGMAVMTNRDDPKNPARYKRWGTEGYRAPVSVQDPAELNVWLIPRVGAAGYGKRIPAVLLYQCLGHRRNDVRTSDLS